MVDFDEIEELPRIGAPRPAVPAVMVRTPAPIERLVAPSGAVVGSPSLRLREILAREGVSDVESLSLTACSLIYGEIHGVSITPEALGYRLKRRNTSKFEVLCLPKSHRGKRSSAAEGDRRAGRSGRPRTKSQFAPPCPSGYIYCHLDYASGSDPEIRFIGYGRGSAFCDTSGLLCDYEPAHLEWLTRWNEHSGRLISGLRPECLENPNWIVESGHAPSSTTTSTPVILVSKMLNSPESTARLLYIRLHRAGHALFKEASYWAPGT